MSDAVSFPPRRGPVPKTAFITACETVTWIAWGQAKTLGDIQDQGWDAVVRWGTSALGQVLEALEARSAPEPYCTIREEFSPRGRFSRKGPSVLREIRARARKRTGMLVSYSELASELRGEIEGLREDFIVHAVAELMEALRAKKITARGQRHHANGDKNPGAEHTSIPVDALIHPSVTIQLWNQIGIDADTDLLAWRAAKGMAYEDVRLKTSEVLALWPPDPARTAPCNGIGGRPERAAPRTKEIGESCIITDAIARLAYGSSYDGRYYAAPGNKYEEAEARNLRKADVQYPTVSRLPNVPDSRQISPEQYEAAMPRWVQENTARWKGSESLLHAALQAGSIKAFDASGRAVPAEFWLANNCRSPETYRFRLKGKDITGLGAASVNATFSPDGRVHTGSTSNGLPADLASDPKAVAAYDVMVTYARERLESQGTREKRDALAPAVSRKTGYPVRKARELYRYLPEELRNPTRTTHSAP